MEQENKELKQWQRDVIDLLDLLKSGPDDIQHEIQKILKSTTNPTKVLDAVKGSTAYRSLSPSQQEPARFFPGMQSGLEMDLTVDNVFDYSFLGATPSSIDPGCHVMTYQDQIFMDAAAAESPTAVSSTSSPLEDCDLNHWVSAPSLPPSSPASTANSEIPETELSSTSSHLPTACDNPLYSLSMTQWWLG